MKNDAQDDSKVVEESKVPKKMEIPPDTEEMKLKRIIEGTIIKTTDGPKWEDIGGLENVKKGLKDAVINPYIHPELFEGKQGVKGILLFGPPGTGKTFIAKACAKEAKCTFFNINSTELVSKWVGEGER
jgi:SpoVK/Ycf46/Vps4 family AAA+-type ATPase